MRGISIATGREVALYRLPEGTSFLLIRGRGRDVHRIPNRARMIAHTHPEEGATIWSRGDAESLEGHGQKANILITATEAVRLPTWVRCDISYDWGSAKAMQTSLIHGVAQPPAPEGKPIVVELRQWDLAEKRGFRDWAVYTAGEQIARVDHEALAKDRPVVKRTLGGRSGAVRMLTDDTQHLLTPDTQRWVCEKAQLDRAIDFIFQYRSSYGSIWASRHPSDDLRAELGIPDGLDRALPQTRKRPLLPEVKHAIRTLDPRRIKALIDRHGNISRDYRKRYLERLKLLQRDPSQLDRPELR
jgi:hypothetical protein